MRKLSPERGSNLPEVTEAVKWELEFEPRQSDFQFLYPILCLPPSLCIYISFFPIHSPLYLISPKISPPLGSHSSFPGLFAAQLSLHSRDSFASPPWYLSRLIDRAAYCLPPSPGCRLCKTWEPACGAHVNRVPLL